MAEKEGNLTHPAIPKFDGHYDHWSMLMENLLRSKEYWGLIENGVYEPPAGATQEEIKKGEESKLRDFKAKNYLFQAIDRSIMETILVRSTAKDIWNAMKERFAGSTKVKRAQLLAAKREFELLGQKEGESVSDYFQRLMQVVNRMQLFGDTVDQTTIVEKILRSLNKKFGYVVCAIIESNDITKLSVDSLQSSLVVHETMMGVEKEEEQALKVTGRGSNTRGRGRSAGKSGRGRGRGSFNRESIECYNCRKTGHYQYECPNLENKANYAEFDEDEEILLMAQTEDERKPRMWFLDSGCSNHMSGNKDWFLELDESVKVTVRLGNDKRLMTQGHGSIKMEIDGIVQTVTEVYFIPELRSNLLSVGQLQEKGVKGCI